MATDVAARGLDLPLVGLIIHFNLPQNIENYIHRSGRTARIYNEGTSIAFVGPGDTKSLLAIEKLLGRKIDKFQVDNEKLKRSDEMVELACEIAEKESKNMGTTKDSTWTDRASEAIGLDRTEYKQPIGKKHIRNLKKQLSRAKNEIELPRKRGSVITPEMFKLAKLQKLI